MSSRSRNWVFTLFPSNPNNLQTPPIKLPGVKWEAGQWEQCPTTKNIHWQGTVVFNHAHKFSTVKGYFPPDLYTSFHLEQMKGTPAQSYQYCTKFDAWHETIDFVFRYEHGDVPRIALKGAKKATASDKLVERIKGGATVEELAVEFPSLVLRSLSNVKALIQAIGPKHAFTAPSQLRDWQRKLVLHLCYKADDRKIHWIYDPQGGAGKSTVVRYGTSHMGAVVLSGRVQDMAHAYSGQPIVFFDLSRTQADNMDHLYSFAESLKNGIIFSSKYDSGQKTFPPPHVVFMGNFPPDTSKWTSDRLLLTQLSNPTSFHIELHFVADFIHPIATAGGIINQTVYDEWA